MNNDLILMIILVIALIFGNLWLLKRNNKSFHAKRRPTPAASQPKKKPQSTETTATDTGKANKQQDAPQVSDSSDSSGD